MTKSQKMKVAFCIIAVILTVISCVVSFVWMSVQADEVVTTSSYTSSTFPILFNSVYYLNSAWTMQDMVNLTGFSFTLKQGGEGIFVTLGLQGNTTLCPVDASSTGGYETFTSERDISYFNFVNDENELGDYLPFVVSYPTNWSLRFPTSDSLIPSYISFSVEPKIEGSYHYKVFRGSNVEEIPYDVYFTEFVVTIGLKEGDDDAMIVIRFPFYSDVSISSGFNSGIFTTVIPGESQTYNDGYNKGYNVGYDNGKYIESTRVNESSASYIAGKNKGYSEGVNDAGNYTFFSLISSVVDVPIKALVGLLDFNLFGIDMSSLYLSLFTLCIIIAIVKMLL